MTLHGQDFKHYMDVEIAKEDTEQMAIVTEVKITSIRLDDIVEYVYERLDPKNNLREPPVRTAFDALPEERKKALATSMFIYRYCIHRILTHFKVYKNDNWLYHLSDDYYAQDVSSITLKPSIATEVDRCLKHMVPLRDKHKIEFVLELEFKRVLPDLRGKEWSITNVPYDDLLFTNKTLYEKCLESDTEYLQKYRLPRGLCIRNSDGKFRVIDGYHRLSAAIKDEKNEKESCLVIYCRA